jgi:integrase
VRIKDAWKRLGPHFGHMRPVDLTKAETRDYIATRSASTGTIWTELVYLRAALAFAVKEGWLTRAPYVPVPQKPSPREHHLTRAEAQRLHDAAVMPHMKLFIRLALGTAGRAGALLDLTWDRVDLVSRTIDLRDPTRPRTRKGRARVPMSQALHDALLEAHSAALSPFVIEWAGGKVTSVKKGVAAAARRARVTCTPHVLRHTAACWMAEAGVPMTEIAQYLGHEDSRTTERVYARFSPDHLQHAARTLDL